MALTKRQIDAAHYTGRTPKQRVVLWCDDPRGFGLRIFPPIADPATGAMKPERKTFVVFYRTAGGTQRLHTIGDYGTWSLDAARLKAKELLLSVEKEQADPVAEKARTRIEAKTGTVKAMFVAYVDARRKDPRRPMKRGDDLLELAELHIFGKFGARPWQDVKRSEIREWLEGFAKHPSQGNNALRALRAAYNWRLSLEDESPARRSRPGNPAAGIKLFPTKPRQVRLELAQLPGLERAVDQATDDPYLRALFRFILATGCRRSEALNLKWADVSLDGKRAAATFRDTKTADSHTVPLSTEAVAMLRTLPRIADNPHVFPGRGEGAPLVGIDKAWDRARKAAGVPNLRIHDLRRSVGSWLGDAGFSSKQIGTVLGHRTDITSRVYMALGDTTKRQAVDAAAALMRKARKPKAKRKPKKSAQVIQFPNRRAAR
jgi:integrase